MNEIPHPQSPQNIRKTVLEIDLVAYSDVALMLEENLSVEAVKIFQDQVQEFVDHGLNAVGLQRDDIVLATSGDNAILVFDNTETMHRFAQSVQDETFVHNASKSVESAKRWFRMGAATGIVLVIPSERRIVGSTIARAVRLEAAAEKGQLVVDRTTYEALPHDLKRCYGAEEVIHGKRDERFQGRRCTLIDVPKSYAEVTERPRLPTSSSTSDADVVPQLAATGTHISEGRRTPVKMRWFLAAGLGVVTLVIAAMTAIFVAPALLNPPRSKALTEVARRQPATTQAPAAVQPSQPQPTRAAERPVAAPSQPSSVTPLRDAISVRLASVVPNLAVARREEEARAYEVAQVHKAQAVSLEPPRTWRSTGRPTVENAETAALENCQVIYSQPCVLIAVDDAVQTAQHDGNWPRRDMPRARYAGTFDAAQIPGVAPATRERADIVNYRSAPAPKAVAFHANGGRVFTVTGAATQPAAEEDALKTCNGDPDRNRADGPCFLYAIGDTVVLTKRLTAPSTLASTAAAAPSPLPNPPEQTREAFDPEKIPFIIDRESARKYLSAPNAKAFALSRSGKMEWYFGVASAEEAQRRALEACEFFARSPCLLYATNNEVEPAPDGHRPARPALGPGEGTFDHTSVPFVSDSMRRSLVGYASAQASKAVAVSPSGLGYWVTSAANVEEAQRLALERCFDAVRNSSSLSKYPCYLYAVGNSVVFSRRITTPDPAIR